MNKNLVSVDVPYGSSSIRARVPEANLAGVLHPRSMPVRDEQELIRESLARPIASPSLAEFLSSSGKTLVVVNDATRPTPTARVVPVLLEMAKCPEDLWFIVATGAHGPPTSAELAMIFGPSLSSIAPRVLIHHSRKPSEQAYVGTTSAGAHVSLDAAVLEAGRIVVLSSVEPHYFAGYTGGRKSFLPGLAAFESIEQNHSLALKPGVNPLALSGNAVHEDMVEAASFLGGKPVFSINLVLDRDNRIYSTTSGDLHKSFIAATKLADEVFVIPVEARADVVVSVARAPLDRDFYQIQKALEHALPALTKGGVVILVSKCPAGVGEDSYIRFIQRCGTPEVVLERVSKELNFGCHKAGRLAKAVLRGRILAVTDLDPLILKRVFIEPFSFLQAAIDNALSSAGPDARMLFLMNGSITVPRVL